MLQDHTEIYESMLECMSFKVNCLLEFKISCMEDKNGLILEEKKKEKELRKTYFTPPHPLGSSLLQIFKCLVQMLKVKRTISVCFMETESIVIFSLAIISQ